MTKRKCGDCIHFKACAGWNYLLDKTVSADQCKEYRGKIAAKDDLCGGEGWLEDENGCATCPHCGEYAYDEGAHPLRWFPNFCPHCGADLRYNANRSELKEAQMNERRKHLFSELGEVFSSDDKGRFVLYVMKLWRYIADEHGETLEISMENE